MVTIVRVFALTALLPLMASAETVSSNIITIYTNSNQPFNVSSGAGGYGIIQHNSQLNLPTKNNLVTLGGMPKNIDISSIIFKSDTDPENTKLTEIDFTASDNDESRIFEDNIGKQVTISYGTKELTGNLVSKSGTGVYVEDTTGKTVYIADYSSISFANSTPFQTKNQLILQIDTPKPGNHDTSITYQAPGLDWFADYMIVTDPATSKMKFSGTVLIKNDTGSEFKNSRIRLVAGELNQTPRVQNFYMAKSLAAAPEASDGAGFSQENLGEYHMYELNKYININRNNTTRFTFVPETFGINVDSTYEYDANKGQNVRLVYKFANKLDNKLGQPLPQGRIRIYEQTKDKPMALLGEDHIKHTPKDENIQLTAGNSFDIITERKILDTRRNNDAKWSEEDIQVTFKNHKDKPVTIKVTENLNNYNDWVISNNNIAYKKLSSSQIQFEPSAKANDQTIVRYTVHYSWK